MTNDALKFPSMPKMGFRKGKSEFNMSIMIFELLQNMMTDISRAAIYSETTLKARHIINYYTRLKQLYITSSVLFNDDKKREFRIEFRYLHKYIDFVKRQVSNPYAVVRYLNIMQEKLYGAIQEKGVMFYVSYEGSPTKELERKFGIENIKL